MSTYYPQDYRISLPKALRFIFLFSLFWFQSFGIIGKEVEDQSLINTQKIRRRFIQ